MAEAVQVHGLAVAPELHAFVRDEALPGSGIDEDHFWSGLAALLRDLVPINQRLLARRAQLQWALDEWHAEHPGPVTDPAGYESYLREIGYLVDAPPEVAVTTSGVDPEVAVVAGPQLVVPLTNARFAVNAANARWGSLYDALYGTDVVAETQGREKGSSYNPVRGDEVVARARRFLDDAFPLVQGSHVDAEGYAVRDGALEVALPGGPVGLADPAAFVGRRGSEEAPEAVVLVHHGLHVEIVVDRAGPIGGRDRAGVADVVVEAAVTTIMDLEDSVAAVDAADKVAGYRNWLQLMQGTLAEDVTKGGRTFRRELAPDRVLQGPDGEVVLPGRSLLWLRQVGHLMTTDAVRLDGDEVPEGIVDAVVTALCGLVDVQQRGRHRNSRTGAVYAVKPKMHGPEEVAFTDALLARTEALLGLPTGTVKLGIMDEERRASVNLAACIDAARGRVAFINTGFLDRTGDELHTSMLAGPMVRKADMRDTAWIEAYEAQNVAIGLACGLRGRAQIGKGMWARPDDMAAMLEAKIGHPRAGANCAWVPSPTAATLHALHYHQVDVAAVQHELAQQGAGARLADLLTLPVAADAGWSAAERTAELENNLQGVLGYVKRWVDDGIGCSKVPDIHGTALMEDRATCRISSQHVANWVRHGVVTADEVEAALRRMADVVDAQQAAEGYEPMGPGYDGQAFLAARDLVVRGLELPSGYTEPVLHERRRLRKQEDRTQAS
jgi:malate synthase